MTSQKRNNRKSSAVNIKNCNIAKKKVTLHFRLSVPPKKDVPRGCCGLQFKFEATSVEKNKKNLRPSRPLYRKTEGGACLRKTAAGRGIKRSNGISLTRSS